jgi:cytochrome c biogenesis factor
MEANRLQALRKKQVLYLNIGFTAYILLCGSLILARTSAVILYLGLGCLFLFSAIRLQWMKHSAPWLPRFSGMKELEQYESRKLGESWRKYYTSHFILQMVLSLFFFVQAFVRERNVPFSEVIPFWYLALMVLLLFGVGNLNLRLHARRIDRKTAEQLKAYADDKMLFSLVFASVFLVMTILGTLIVLVLTRLKL